MPINNLSAQHDGGFLPGIILMTQCYYNRRTRLNAMEEILYSQPMIPPKRFDISPPDWEILKNGLDAFKFFFKAAVNTILPRSPVFAFCTPKSRPLQA